MIKLNILPKHLQGSKAKRRYNPVDNAIIHVVNPGETVSDIYNTAGLNFFNHKDTFKKLNPGVNPDTISPGIGLLIAPSRPVDNWEDVEYGAGEGNAAYFNKYSKYLYGILEDIKNKNMDFMKEVYGNDVTPKDTANIANSSRAWLNAYNDAEKRLENLRRKNK